MIMFCNTNFVNPLYIYKISLNHFYLIEELGIILDSTSFKIVKEIDYGKKTSQKVDKLFEFKFYPVDNLYDDVPLFDVILK